MTDLLSKPDDAHKPQQAAESKARVVVRGIWLLYVVAALLTLAFQVHVDWGSCGDALHCGLNVGKALVWTVLWPFFWMFHSNGLA